MTRNLVSILCFDVKGDLAHVPDELGRDLWDHYSFNEDLKVGLNPPTGILSPDAWINQVAKVLAARCGLIMSRGCLGAMMRFGAVALNPGPPRPIGYPSIPLLYDIGRYAPLEVFATKPDYGKTLLQVLDDLVGSSGGAFDTLGGFDVVEHVIKPRRCAVIDMTAVSPLLCNLVVDLVISQLLYSRLSERHTVDTTEVLLVLDEADHLCSARSSSVYPEGFSPLGQLLKQGREFGIMVCVSLCHLGQASQFIRSNVAYHFIMNQPDHESVYEAARTLHIPRGGEVQLSMLRPGECIYRESQGPCSWPMLMRPDFIPPSRAPRPETFDQHPYLPGARLQDLPHVQDALDGLIAEHKRTKLRQAQRSTGKKPRVSRYAHAIIHSIATHPWAPARALWEATGEVPAPSVQKAVRKELGDAGMAASEQIRLGSANVLLYELLKAAWEYLHRAPPKHIGRGSISHRHISHWVAMDGEKKGFEAVCEWVAPGSGHAIDCAWKIEPGISHAHEVIVKSLDNIIKHLEALNRSPAVRLITIVCLQKKIIADLQRRLASEPIVRALGDRLRWELAETYLRRLWP